MYFQKPGRNYENLRRNFRNLKKICQNNVALYFYEMILFFKTLINVTKQNALFSNIVLHKKTKLKRQGTLSYPVF